MMMCETLIKVNLDFSTEDSEFSSYITLALFPRTHTVKKVIVTTIEYFQSTANQ